MDCKTARMLLSFDRPKATELDPHDAQELAGHLDHCRDCEASARSERQLEERLGRAMRNVEVPEALHKNLVARLEAERGDFYRRRIGHFVRMGAIAAALLLLVWGIVHVSRPGPAKIDFAELCRTHTEFHIAPDFQKVEESLRALEVEAQVPKDLRYIYLVAPPSLAKFQKERVPMLVFVRTQANQPDRDPDRACVYLLSGKQFDLTNVRETFAEPGIYHFRIAVVRQDDEHAYLVLHTGENWDWLRVTP